MHKKTWIYLQVLIAGIHFIPTTWLVCAPSQFKKSQVRNGWSQVLSGWKSRTKKEITPYLTRSYLLVSIAGTGFEPATSGFSITCITLTSISAPRKYYELFEALDLIVDWYYVPEPAYPAIVYILDKHRRRVYSDGEAQTVCLLLFFLSEISHAHLERWCLIGVYFQTCVWNLTTPTYTAQQNTHNNNKLL